MSGSNATDNVANEQTPWRKIFTQLQEDGVEFFLNSQLEPSIFLKDDGFRKEWPADSQRVQDLLMSMYFEMANGAILKSAERELLLALIREECRRGGRRLTEAEAEATDSDVVVQGMVALVNGSSTQHEDGEAPTIFSGRTVLLLQLLRDLQKKGILRFRRPRSLS